MKGQLSTHGFSISLTDGRTYYSPYKGDYGSSHLWLVSVDMDPIFELARKHGLKIIEDVWKTYKGRHAAVSVISVSSAFTPTLIRPPAANRQSNSRTILSFFNRFTVSLFRRLQDISVGKCLAPNIYRGSHRCRLNTCSRRKQQRPRDQETIPHHHPSHSRVGLYPDE